MSNSAGLFSSSLGRKYLMALTGLFLCSFLLIHLLGNVALFTDPVQFNEYTRFMSSNPIIRVMEIILVLGFLTHIVDAVMLSKANRLLPIDDEYRCVFMHVTFPKMHRLVPFNLRCTDWCPSTMDLHR